MQFWKGLRRSSDTAALEAGPEKTRQASRRSLETFLPATS